MSRHLPIVRKPSRFFATSQQHGGSRILRMTLRRHGKPTVITWADSRTCPARPKPSAICDPSHATPSLPSDPADLILDGVGYRVRFRAHYGSEIGFPLELNSNAGTPLAEWVNRTRVMLKPCWTMTRPEKDV